MGQQYNIENPMHDDPNLPTGWFRKVVRRLIGYTAGKWDVYIFSPEGTRFRSKKELKVYLLGTSSSHKLEEFDFSVRGKSQTIRGRPPSKSPKKLDSNDKQSNSLLQKTNQVMAPPPPASNKRKLSASPKAVPPAHTLFPKRSCVEGLTQPKSSSSSEDEEDLMDDNQEPMMKGQPQSESNTISRPKSKKAITKGAVVKIHLKNFMTYNEVVFSPGPKLNLFPGPNVTKSTIMSAIYLGMNGKPSLLSGDKTLGDYVRHGATKATIDIELYNPDGPNYRITREISAIDNKSTWKYQGKYATEEQINQLIQGLGTKVDQFITQEQVQNFSRMNDKELLNHTMSAVGNAQLEKDFVELKKMQDDLVRVANHQDKDEEEVLNQQIEQKKSEFLRGILDLVSRINDSFSRYYASMHCSGEVMLYTGENQDDFENYGIKMRVQYKSEEPLFELSANHHSDGEISLATTLYMLAMQEISHVPFCCIDEINQGMGSFNERRVYDVLVQIARQESSAQYFLLTPKFEW